MKQVIQQLPIFIINLPEAVKRQAFMQKQLMQHKLKGEFFKASRGKDLTRDFLSKFQIEKGTNLSNRKLSQGELGCVFSHYFLLKKIVEEKIPAVLVLEDDAILTKESTLLINNFQTLPQGWDLLNIGHRSASLLGEPFIGKKTYPLSLRYREKVTFDGVTIHLAPLTHLTYGTYAYIVTKEGAEHLLQVIEQQPILPLDHFLDANKEYLRYYGTSPSLVNHLDVYLDDNDIEQHIMSGRTNNMNTPLISNLEKLSQYSGLKKIKFMFYMNLALKDHFLSYPYNKARYLWGSFLKTKILISRPVMREES